MTDRAKVIFGNEIDDKTFAKACKNKANFVKKFGDDSGVAYHLAAEELPVLTEAMGTRKLVLADTPLDLAADAKAAAVKTKTERTVKGASGKPVVVGNIRMGFGHYRISMAMASAAHAMGYTPYWCDLASFEGSTCSKVISYQNDLYSMGSRLSQKISLFNKLYWEPLNSEGFRKLTYNASDQKAAELMAYPLVDLPKDVPYIGTHAWPSQAAVHAGLTHVVNAIPDNWPMALHLAEGSIHTVQTPGATLGYRNLRGFDQKRSLKPMPADAITYTGHYIDHELVANIHADCERRRNRVAGGGPVRYLLTVGGAGAQQKLFADITEHLLPYVKRGEAVLFINVGDHEDVWNGLVESVDGLGAIAEKHFADFAGTAAFAEAALDGEVSGVHAFCDSDIFSAVYSTNLLMRCCDVLATKPSELSFYPVPKLMIHRVGGHEAWGAICAAEIGDGTYEIDDTREVLDMIDSMQANRDIITTMCDNIETANEQHIYDGAYECVRLAVAGKIE